ncbi:MAG TPA: DUF541 domain-containing protein [Aliiroseovarius sp.]|nr:DUF541 domain-containing protein [Aliiroseovarius sp.]
MRILAIVLGFLALFAHGALAQDSPRTISVSGAGSVEAPPDMATITLGVSQQARSAGEALAAVSEVSAAIFARLEATGVAARDMQTSNLNLNPLFSDRSSVSNAPPRIVGYQVSNMITIRVRELDDLGAILDQVAKDGANTFNGLQFGLVAPEPLAAKARVAAVKDAIARAELLANAAGVRLGPVLSISDQSGGGPRPVMADMAFARSVEAMPVAGGELSIQASVSMVFGIIE